MKFTKHHRRLSPVPAALLACCLSAMLPGCSSNSARTGINADPSKTAAAASLEHRASLELIRKTRPADVPAPPGVPSFAITPPAIASPLMTATREQVMQLLAEQLEWPPGDPPAAGPAPTRRQQDEALKLYARGRDASLLNRHYEAATTLGAALERDPGAVPVMTLLARTYSALGGRDKATEMWQRIAHHQPDHPEAVFELALAAADRRNFAASAGILSYAELNEIAFDFDPAADTLAMFALTYALQQLGYDRASVDTAQALLDGPARRTDRYHERLTSVLQQLGDVQSRMGDALSRLGNLEESLRAYAAAAHRPLSDPGTLYPRVIYANAHLGRTHSAQFELFSAVQSTGSPVSVRLLLLAAYLREFAAPVDTLVRAVREEAANRTGAHDLARLEARLLRPLDGTARLEAAMRRLDRQAQPRQWLTLAADQIMLLATTDASRAVARTIDLITQSPDDAEALALALAASVPDPAEAADVAQRSQPADIGSLLAARLLMSMDGYGQAWKLLDQLSDDERNTPLIIRTQLEIAARLNEPQLLEERSLAGAMHDDDPLMWIARAAAWRTIGELDRAQHAAGRAASHGGQHQTAALIEHAHVLLAMSAANTAQQDQRLLHAQDAAVILQRVLKDDPAAMLAAEMLASLYGPTGTLQNPDRYREIARVVFQHGRETPAFLRLAAQENLGRQRPLAALELALTLAAHDPSDIEALNLALQGFAAVDRLDDARRWIDEQRTRRPGNPALIERRVQVMAASEQMPRIHDWLTQLRAQQPNNIAVARLLEQVARQVGDDETAAALTLERLHSRPDGIRKYLELAAHHASRGQIAEMLTSIDTVLDSAAVATSQQLINAVGVLNRARSELADDLSPTEVQMISAALLRAASRAVQHDPAMPLQIHGMLLRGRAELGELGDDFDRMVIQAILHSPGAGGVGPRDAILWRDLAQALIDEGHHAAAARILQTRLMTSPLPDKAATTILARIIIAINASVGGLADSTIAVLHDLHDAGRAPVWNSDENPTLATSCYEASQIHSLAGDDAGSIALLRAAVDAGATDAMVFNNLGYMLLDAVKTPAEEAQAERLLMRAHRLDPEDANILDSLGHLRYLQGFLEDFINTDPNAADDELQLPGARTLIGRAVDAGEQTGGTPSPEVYEHFGDTLWRSGDREAAARAWQQGYDLLVGQQRTQTILRNYELVQTRVWGIRVFDPQQAHQQSNSPDRQRLMQKLEAAANGQPPDIELTFAERRARSVVSSDRPPASNH